MSWWLRCLVIIIVVIVVIVLIAWLLIWATANSYLFYPEYSCKWMPPYDYKAVYIDRYSYKHETVKNEPWEQYQKQWKTDHKFVYGWHFDDFGGPDAYTVIFYHGNAGNITQREYVISICRRFKINLLVIDYRGFGKSPGKPTTPGCCQDGIAAYEYLNKCVPASKIVLWGESLGGGVAAYVASERSCRCLILMSTFSSIDDAIRYSTAKIPCKGMIASILPKIIDCMPSKEKVKKLKHTPVAVIHSTEDELINYKCAEIMYKAVPHPCKIIIPIKGGHSSPDMKEIELSQLLTFAGASLDRCHRPEITVMSEHLRTVGSTIFD